MYVVYSASFHVTNLVEHSQHVAWMAVVVCWWFFEQTAGSVPRWPTFGTVFGTKEFKRSISSSISNIIFHFNHYHHTCIQKIVYKIDATSRCNSTLLELLFIPVFIFYFDEFVRSFVRSSIRSSVRFCKSRVIQFNRQLLGIDSNRIAFFLKSWCFESFVFSRSISVEFQFEICVQYFWKGLKSHIESFQKRRRRRDNNKYSSATTRTVRIAFLYEKIRRWIRGQYNNNNHPQNYWHAFAWGSCLPMW